MGLSWHGLIIKDDETPYEHETKWKVPPPPQKDISGWWQTDEVISCHVMQKKETVWEETEEEQLEEYKDIWRGLAPRWPIMTHKKWEILGGGISSGKTLPPQEMCGIKMES